MLFDFNLQQDSVALAIRFPLHSACVRYPENNQLITSKQYTKVITSKTFKNKIV